METKGQMPKGVNYPLFVPSSCRDVAKLIAARHSDAAVELLWKKVRGANREAAALLAYIHLRGGAQNSDFGSAYRECKIAAEAGDAYAQLVRAQVLASAQSYSESVRWLALACNQKFPPAFAHMGRLMTNGLGFAQQDRLGGLRMYWAALKTGHVPTLVLVAKNLSGAQNSIVRLAGALLAPVAIILNAISVGLAPFSVRNFVHIPSDQPPLFTPVKTKSD